MREVVVGIKVTARDGTKEAFASAKASASSSGRGMEDAAKKAKGGFSGILAVVGGAGKAIEGAGERARAGFKAMGMVAVGINQSLELGKKAFNTFRVGFEATVGKSLEYRAETDRGRLAWSAYRDQLERIRALVGDAVLPLFLGLGDATADVTREVERWLKANRQLVGSALIEWLSKAAVLLVDGVLKGVELVAGAWAGWSIMIDKSRALIDRFVAGVFSGMAKVEGVFLRAARAIGADGIGAALEEDIKFATNASDVITGMAEEQEASAKRTAMAHVQLQMALHSVGEVAKSAIGDTASKAMDRLNDGIDRFDPRKFAAFTQGLEASGKHLATSLAMIDFERSFTPAEKAKASVMLLSAEIERLEEMLPRLGGPYLDAAVAKLKELKGQLTGQEMRETAIAAEGLNRALAGIESRSLKKAFSSDQYSQQLQRAEQETETWWNKIKGIQIESAEDLAAVSGAIAKRNSQLSVEMQIEAGEYVQQKQIDLAKDTGSQIADVLRNTWDALLSSFDGIGKGGEAARDRMVDLKKEIGETQHALQGMTGKEIVRARDHITDLNAELVKTGDLAKEETKTMADGFAQFGTSLLKSAQNVLMTKAVEAAAKAIAAYADIPFAGLALGLAAAAGLTATILGLSGKLPKFHEGGVIQGRRGEETPIMALAGEGVIVEENVPRAKALGLLPGGPIAPTMGGSSASAVRSSASSVLRSSTPAPSSNGLRASGASASGSRASTTPAPSPVSVKVHAEIESVLPTTARIVRTTTQSLNPAQRLASRYGWRA